MPICRRSFVKQAALAFAAERLVFGAETPAESQSDILRRIKPPVFPKRDFDIVRFGAEAGGTKDCTSAIRKAIAACTGAGGGRVVIPAGIYLTGPVHLDNNVNLYVSEGATLRFSQKPEDYLPVVYTRWEGTECMNYSPLNLCVRKDEHRHYRHGNTGRRR